MNTGDGSLKPGWTRVAFGDVVRLSRERAPDPEAAGFTRYVGLEHVDPGDLTIRRWGSVSDGTTFTNVFRPGQVLFGKRRAYLRKVAVPDFGGVCSGDVYVLESKDDRRLLPDLLPFICQTDAFFEHAVGTSAGSLSPRTNWQALATHEFALPPLEKQRRISKVLHTLREARERWRACHRSLQRAGESMTIAVCGRLLDTCPLVRLGDVADVRYGLSITPSRRLSSGALRAVGNPPKARNARVPYLRVANVLRNIVDLSDVKMTNELDGDDKKYQLRVGDLLVVEGHADPLEIGRTCVWRHRIRMLHQNHVIRARCREPIPPDYICAIMNSPQGKQYFRAQAKSSSGLYTINSKVVGDYRLPLPPPSTQRSIATKVESLRLVADRIMTDRVKRIEALTKSTLRTLFS